MERKESFRLFWKILKENLTDMEALDGIKEFFGEIKKASQFLFWLTIALTGGYAGIFIYNLLSQGSQIQLIAMSLSWGCFGLAILEIYSRTRGKKRRLRDGKWKSPK